MGMNLVQAGGAAAAGLISGMLEKQAPVLIGGQSIPASALAEGVALIGGVALQFLAPYTMPALVDGLVDGGVALLAKRVVTMAVPAASGYNMATRVGALNAGYRGLNASGVASNRYQFI